MSKSTLHLAYVAAGLTCTGMADLLRNASGNASEDQAARVTAIVSPLLNMAFSDGRKFLTDTVASTKATKDSKPDHVVEQRASEARQIYGALKLVEGFKVERMGWEAALTAARKSLQDAGINASGNKRLTGAEKAEAAIKTAAQPIFAELMLKPENGERKASEIAAEAQRQAAASISGSEVQKHAERIVKANGAEYAARLVDALSKAIALVEVADHRLILPGTPPGFDTEQPPVVTDGVQPKAATGKAREKRGA